MLNIAKSLAHESVSVTLLYVVSCTISNNKSIYLFQCFFKANSLPLGLINMYITYLDGRAYVYLVFKVQKIVP